MKKRFYVGRFDDTGWAVYDRTGQEQPVQTMGLDDGDRLAEEKNREGGRQGGDE